MLLTMNPGISPLRSAPLETGLITPAKTRDVAVDKTSSDLAAVALVSVLASLGKLAEAYKGIAPSITAPAVAPDSSLLRQQFQEFGGRLQSVQLQLQRAGEVSGQNADHASPVGSIDFSAANVQRQDNSAAAGEQSNHREQQSAEDDAPSQAGSGLLGGAMSAKAQLMVQLIQSETKVRNADRTSAADQSKLSWNSTQKAAAKEVASGVARRNELITSGATNFAMTGMGTVQSHRGIKTQKTALTNHKAPSMNHQNSAMDLNHAAQVKTGSSLAGQRGSNAGAAGLTDDTPDRTQRDHIALSRPDQNRQQHAAGHQFEYDHMHLTGQRQQANGHAITSSANAAGGLSGAQFGMDASQAQSDKQIAEGAARIHDATASQKEKQAEADAALMAALMAAMQQVATANTEAASAVASNMAR